MKFWLARIGEALLTLWLLATLCFFLLRAAPGGPFDSEKSAPPEVQAAIEAQYHFDQPLLSQYGHWLGDVVRGQLGPSFQYPDYSVNELIAASLPVSLLNGSLALLLALLVGLPLGVWAALHSGSWLDRLLMLGASLGLAMPKFVVAPLLILLFAVTLQWLPAGGWDGSWRSVILPVIALSLPSAGRGLFAGRAWPGTVGDTAAVRARLATGLAARGRVAVACADQRGERIGRGRAGLRHSRRRPLFRAGRAQSRLHAGAGRGVGHRCSHRSHQCPG